MHLKYPNLYQNCLDELHQSNTSNDPEKKKIEDGYAIALKYWKILQDQIKEEGFATEKEEIQFFKHEKPQFTALIEYYILRYQALLFTPIRPQDHKEYWINELRRIDKFLSANHVFIAYYRSNSTQQDHKFFLRSYTHPPSDQIHVYNQDPETATFYDWLPTMLIAFDLYRQYVNEQLAGH